MAASIGHVREGEGDGYWSSTGRELPLGLLGSRRRRQVGREELAGRMGTLDSIPGRFPPLQAHGATAKLTALGKALPKNDASGEFDGTTLRFSREIALAAPERPMPLTLRVKP
jgi:hypothetical protein